MNEKRSPATIYFCDQMTERKRVRDAWRKDAGDLLFAHEAACSAVITCIKRQSGKKFEKQSAAMEGRLSLTAQFVQGIDMCECAISEGLYAQAAALLKQEMEIIEAVHEFETGTRRDGKTPQLRRLKELGRVYGQYNEFAHASVDSIAKLIVTAEQGQWCGPSVHPIYNREIAGSFYGMHTYFIIIMAGQIHSVMQEIYSVGLSGEEQKLLFVSLELLKKEDVIQNKP